MIVTSLTVPLMKYLRYLLNRFWVLTLIKKSGKHLPQLYRRIEEINSHPEVLKKISKFDGANFRGLDYLNPLSERDSIFRISADTIVEIVQIKKTCRDW